LPVAGLGARLRVHDGEGLPGTVEELLAVPREHPAGDAVQDLLFLALLEVVAVERPAAAVPVPAVSVGLAQVEHGLGVYLQAPQIVPGAHVGEGERAGGEPLGLELDRLRLRLGGDVLPVLFLRLGPVLLLLVLLGGGLPGLELVGGGCGAPLGRLRVVVVPDREEAWHLRVQRGHEDARGVAVQVVELEGAEHGAEVAVGEEEELLAVGGEHGIRVLGQAVREGDALLRGHVVDDDAGEAAGAALLVGEVAAVGRPGVGREVLEAAPVHLDGIAAAGVHQEEALRAVGEGQLLAVRRPPRRVLPALPAPGDLACGGGAVQGAHVQLVLAGVVGEVGHGATVRGEGGGVLAHALGLGQVADGPVLGGHGEQLAPRFEQGAAPRRARGRRR
jgi:hypothetical protein